MHGSLSFVKPFFKVRSGIDELNVEDFVERD